MGDLREVDRLHFFPGPAGLDLGNAQQSVEGFQNSVDIVSQVDEKIGFDLGSRGQGRLNPRSHMGQGRAEIVGDLISDFSHAIDQRLIFGQQLIEVIGEGIEFVRWGACGNAFAPSALKNAQDGFVHTLDSTQ